MSLRKFALVSTFLVFAGTSSCLDAQAGDPAAIQQKLYAQIRLTTITADRSDIVTAGDIVTIQKPGLMMYATNSPMPPSNTYKNGKIGQGWGGFGKDMMITMAAPGGATATDYPHRPFAPEEKCWVTGMQVQRDGVLFQLYSDPYDGVRYYANLKIPFPDKKVVPPVDVAMQTVAEVLTVVPQDNQEGQSTQPQGPQQSAIAGQYFLKETGATLFLNPDGSFTLSGRNGVQSPGQYSVNGNRLTMTYNSTGRSSIFTIQNDQFVTDTGMAWVRQGEVPSPAPDNSQAPAPAPMPDIAPPPPPANAPPPPPANAPPPTIAIGQTMDQVTTGFGQPLKVAKLGTKVFFYYKDMKVTFTNGKVSDVE